MLEDLKDSVVVLFGAGRNGEFMLNTLIKCGIRPMYFVDNNREIKAVAHTDECDKETVFAVNSPDALLDEGIAKLKIIITPSGHLNAEIESQLYKMGLGDCVYKNLTKVESKSDAFWFSLPRQNKEALPVPPRSLMVHSELEEVHLETGKRDFREICAMLARNDISISDVGRLLDFGCANCRILRHFINMAEDISLWGTDIKADKIFWAIENLPGLNLIVNNESPPLPFTDAFFGFIYAGSVFTHLMEYHTAWIAELARITKPGGHIYITLHDEDCMREVFRDQKRFGSFTDGLIKDDFLRDLMMRFDFDFLSVGKDNTSRSQVFMSSTYIEKITSEFFSLVDIAPRAYARFQTAYLYKRK